MTAEQAVSALCVFPLRWSASRISSFTDGGHAVGVSSGQLLELKGPFSSVIQLSFSNCPSFPTINLGVDHYIIEDLMYYQ